MKSSKCSLLFLTIMIFCSFSGLALAVQIKAGDKVKLYDGPGTSPGGEFKVDISPYGTPKPQVDFISFCLEFTEFISLGKEYTVGSVSRDAVGGGGGAVNGKDPIDYKTAFLYYQFATETLDDAGFYNYNNATLRSSSANTLQYAIWILEGEKTLNELKAMYSLSSTQQTAVTNLLTYATNNAINMDYGVRSVNLIETINGQTVQRQSQLVLVPVPEPGTLLLVAVGLLGMAAYRRSYQ